ncbi:peptidyl-prolyl cis-trans isomerase [Alteromonas sp. KUL42]|uniref:FKBP-type peptidyl-prolyl cis-trans isomerase n=1 Tax=Alteromonas sp. KUL42 TaxID=2480797 RepID=UPI0010359E8E|nr:FKBP-type peptidyl-prolyl cis-trans isomerase [Alteromonas sp. KUL42]TAP32339.1 FKBP-type peptidyl-prolyl cis-trans isomerase [Alteromonas sp. KUL42]GEA08760.1 peptidyl-prolyl cis-trans isomerase [Alteromonas sp. KUL42]
MQKSLVALSTIAALGLFACQPNTSDEAASSSADSANTTSVSAEEMTNSQKQAYAMGASMGLFVSNRAEQQEQLGMSLDKEALKQGFNDGLADTLKFTPEQIQQIAQEGEEAIRAKQQEMAAQAAEKNVEAGIAYLEENGKRDGVVTTESGLQYEVLTEGTGASPVATDVVKVHYRGTLLDGTEFDSSYKRGEPAEFPLNRVISGWTEGVQLMKEGAKYRFHIPSELAYGQRSTGSITPNSTLIFDVELLEVVKPEAEEAAE